MPATRTAGADTHDPADIHLDIDVGVDVDPLPVRVRVCDGEDVSSYAIRLAAANGLTVRDVETALRPRGLLTSTSPRDSSRLRVWRQLGQLHPTAFTTPDEVDQTWVTSRPLCLACTRGVVAVGRRADAGWVCLRHHRWLGAQQHDASDQPGLSRAERRLRRHLVPRGVLFDSPAMLFALELAQLGTISTPPSRRRAAPRGGWEPTPELYSSQVNWAIVVTEPSFLAALSHPYSARDRIDALARATGALTNEQAWRTRSRLLRLGEARRRAWLATARPTLPGFDHEPQSAPDAAPRWPPEPPPGLADIFLSVL